MSDVLDREQQRTNVPTEHVAIADPSANANTKGLPCRDEASPARFTPGPWTIAERTAQYRAVPANDRERELLERVGKTQFTALSVGTAKGQVAIIPLDESNEANAALIAAAPELLTALKSLLTQINNIEGLGEWEAIDINRTLRKKVRGRWMKLFILATPLSPKPKDEQHDRPHRLVLRALG